ncbi:MAG: ComF family protein, partial [Verrucomicrobia bacterium]|nr:ComF family protein [Verrucomicrobiota bacterium]
RAGAGEGYVCSRCRQTVRFITPPFCGRCGLPFAGEITQPFACSNCRELKLHFRWARSAVSARGLVLDVIHRYKYQRALWFEPFLGDLLVRQAAPALAVERWDLIVPVPLHPAKQREREFNQAERLAARLSAATKIPMNARALERVQFTKTQTMLSRSERTANVRTAFAVPRRQRFDGARIVLVDDVLTTGATTSACALALRRRGAEDIGVWTVARGL